jgi:hypothetical protein
VNRETFVRMIILLGILIALVQAVRLLRAVAFSEGWLTGYYDAQTGGAPARPPLLIVPDPAPTPGTARPVFSEGSEVLP